ncbi:MAG TPA: helix-turn-helix domain-containing protein [Ktedonobacteraceae bacterium]|nr:helix-turn-helix domain-containing protein [Ktedonobacteraceae bacterium]
MGRTTQTPRGFYSAAEAIRKLGVPKSTFYDMVERGQIKKVVPPNRSDGIYPKAEIDKMAKANTLFMLQYATDTSVFEKAQEEDIEGITELCIELFGKNGTASYETRLAQYRSDPDIFYVTKQDDVIVGYVGMFPLRQEAIEQIMSGEDEATFRVGILSPENITQFKPGEADNVFLVIGVKQKLPKTRLYGARTITGAIETMEQFARQGVIIKKLYGTSRTHDGIKLAKDLQFKQVTPVSEKDDLLRFELDLETTKNPLFSEYQHIIKQASAKKQKVEISSSRSDFSDNNHRKRG